MDIFFKNWILKELDRIVKISGGITHKHMSDDAQRNGLLQNSKLTLDAFTEKGAVSSNAGRRIGISEET